MTNLEGYKYLEEVPASTENAERIQALTLQDLLAGGFENPTEQANPENPQKVDKQQARLENNPDRYSAIANESDIIEAYLAEGEWHVGDEAPFVENFFARMALKAASRIRLLRKFKIGQLKQKAHGAFGLVTSDDLEAETRQEMNRELLSRSIGKAATRSAAVINIVLHDNDPAKSVAEELGFRPVGRRASAAGAKGLKQRRYQRAI